jgi:hypothetical protein
MKVPIPDEPVFLHSRCLTAPKDWKTLKILRLLSALGLLCLFELKELGREITS